MPSRCASQRVDPALVAYAVQLSILNAVVDPDQRLVVCQPVNFADAADRTSAVGGERDQSAVGGEPDDLKGLPSPADWARWVGQC